MSDSKRQIQIQKSDSNFHRKFIFCSKWGIFELKNTKIQNFLLNLVIRLFQYFCVVTEI